VTMPYTFSGSTTVFAHRNHLHYVCYCRQVIFCVHVLSGGGTGWWQCLLT